MNKQTFAFQVLWECSSWVSRNVTVQILFLTPTRNIAAGKFVKLIRSLAVLCEYIFGNVDWIEARKIREVFKMSDLFCYFFFFWPWDFLWLDFLGVPFAVREGEIIPLLSKLIWVMLETYYLVRKYTHAYLVSENILFSTRNPLILLMSEFSLQKSAFSWNSTFTQSNIMRAFTA